MRQRRSVRRDAAAATDIIIVAAALLQLLPPTEEKRDLLQRSIDTIDCLGANNCQVLCARTTMEGWTCGSETPLSGCYTLDFGCVRQTSEQTDAIAIAT